MTKKKIPAAGKKQQTSKKVAPAVEKEETPKKPEPAPVSPLKLEMADWLGLNSDSTFTFEELFILARRRGVGLRFMDRFSDQTFRELDNVIAQRDA